MPRSHNWRGPIVEQLIDFEVDPERRWIENAACLGMDTELFFTFSTWSTALKACEKCPVKLDCLADVLEEPKQFGISGGETPEDRYNIRRALRNARRRRRKQLVGL